MKLLAGVLALCLLGGLAACNGLRRDPRTLGDADDAARLSGTLVVANMEDSTASIIDLASGYTRATLPTGRWPHEVAVSDDGRFAVVTNYGRREAPGTTLTVIDLEDVTATRTIDLGDYQRPHGTAFLPGSTILAVTCEASERVVLVDVSRGTLLGTMPTGQPASHMLAVTANGKRIYTANSAPGTITELDVETQSALRTLPVAPKAEAIGVIPSGKQVWVGSSEKGTVSIVDVARGAVVHTLTDFGYPYRIAFTPDARFAVISDPKKGVLRFVRIARGLPQTTVSIPTDGIVPSTEFSGSPSPEGIAITRDGRIAYVTLQGRNQVAAVELPSGRITRYLNTGAWPDGIAYSARIAAERPMPRGQQTARRMPGVER